MPRTGVFQYLSIDRVRYGAPFDEAVAAESELVGAERVFVLASGTLVRETDCIDRLQPPSAENTPGCTTRSAHTRHVTRSSGRPIWPVTPGPT